MRKTPALFSSLAVAAVVVAILSGCSSSASSSALYSSGDASTTVKVSGSTSKEATVDFPTPLVVKNSQVTVDTRGSGAPIQEGDQVDFEYTVLSGATGETLGSSGHGAEGATTPRAAVVSDVSGKPTTSLIRSLRGATTGERYTLVTTAKAGFGAGKLTSNGIRDSDTLVIVVDIKDHFPGKANGANQLPLDGMPDVVTAVSGQPGIVVQPVAAPKELRIETVKAGSGATVKKKDTIHLKFSGWTWPAIGDKPVTWDESTWTSNQAIDLEVSSTDNGGSLPPGLYRALLGVKVGSQVLAVIPPKDGFPSGAAPTGIDANSTLIMVIDVLGIK